MHRRAKETAIFFVDRLPQRRKIDTAITGFERKAVEKPSRAVTKCEKILLI